MLSIFSCVVWLSVCLRWENVYSGPLPIFQLGWLGVFYFELYEFFKYWVGQKVHSGFSIRCYRTFLLLFSHSVVSSSFRPHGLHAAHQVSLSFTISQNLLKLMSIELMMPSNHLILCCPLLLLPSVFPRIRVFSSELAPHVRWPEYWSFSIHPSSEYPGLISFRIDWFELLAIQGSLENLL